MTPPHIDRSSLTGFAHNPLNRLSERREDAAFMAGLAENTAARTLVLSGDTPVLRLDGDRLDPLFEILAPWRLGKVRELVFLGESGRGPLFATLIEAAPEPLLAAGCKMIDLRSLITQGALDSDLLGALGQAKSVMHWHQRHRFCANCGAPTRMAASGWRRECDSCQAQHFPRTDPVVIMLAVQGDACLLGRQSRFAPGMYSCLAGFLEPGETIEDAVRRELQEEAGIAVGPVNYRSSQPWPFPASLMIGCIAQALGRDLVIDREELEDARWFSRGEAASILAGTHPDSFSSPPPMAIAHHLLRDWLDEPGN